MAYDRQDDDVFQVAQGVANLSKALKDSPMPKSMVDAEFARLARVARILPKDEGKLTPYDDIASIGESFAEGRSDASRAAGFLDDVLADVRGMYAMPIVYEGADLGDRDEKLRRDNHLPGERVSIAIRNGVPVEVPGLSPEDGPLTIARTIAVGEVYPGDQGRPVTIDRVHYEFEGHEGRHSADLFHSENGQGHAYGVIQVRDDRMFLTPVMDFLDDERIIVPTGETREIVGDAGRSVFEYVHPDGFSGLKEQVAADHASQSHADKGAIAGEISYDTASQGDLSGPIRIAGLPWYAGATPEQIEVSDRAIDAFLATEARIAQGLGARDPDSPGSRAESFVDKIALELQDAPALFAPSKHPEGIIDYVVGKEASSHSDLPERLEKVAREHEGRLTTFAVAETPASAVSAYKAPGQDVQWQAIDVRTGELIPGGTTDNARSILESMKAFETGRSGVDAPEEKRGLLSQAGSLGLAAAPTQAKGMKDDTAVYVAAGLGKGGQDR